MCGLDSTVVASLERQGLGASTGLTLLGLPGDRSERLSLLGVEGDSPGLWNWVSFGFGATGGFCMAKERKTKEMHLRFYVKFSPLNQSC